MGRRAVDAGEDQATRNRTTGEQARLRHLRVERTDHVLVEADRLTVLDFLQAVFVLESHAEVDREPLRSRASRPGCRRRSTW